jgi:hypothetical protein
MKQIKLWIAPALIVLFFVAAGHSFGQNPIRVQFAKGKTSAVAKGSTGSFGVTYVVGARSGQKLVVTLNPTFGAGIKVETVGKDGEQVLLREEHGGTYEIGLEESGDYTIFVGSTSGRPVSFTLTIKITKMTDI